VGRGHSFAIIIAFRRLTVIFLSLTLPSLFFRAPSLARPAHRWDVRLLESVHLVLILVLLRIELIAHNVAKRNINATNGLDDLRSLVSSFILCNEHTHSVCIPSKVDIPACSNTTIEI
jgi:hypothetical protein